MPKALSRNVRLLQGVLLEYRGDKEATGLPHGRGKARFRSGNRYEGEWAMGLMHGRGTYFFTNGVVYQGQIQNGSITGRGVFTWADAVYEGEVFEGYPHGKGKWTQESSGVEYDGDWKNGAKHGKGTLKIRANGKTSTYEGDFALNKRHGYGFMIYPNGNRYDGEWVLGEKHGRGTMQWFDRNETYCGEWYRDQIHGVGENTWAVPNLEMAQDTTRLFTQHNRYQGQFSQGERDGYGRMSYADGSIYEGYFVDSAKHGYGCFLKDRHLHFGYMMDDRLGPNMVTVKIREDEDVSRSLMNILQDLLSNGEVCEAKHNVIAQFLEDSKNGA